MGADPADLERAVEALSDGIVIRDIDGGLVHANRSAREIVRAAGADLSSAGGDLTAFYEDADRDAHDPTTGDAAQRLLGTGAPVEDVVVGFASPDGDNRWISVTTDSIHDEYGAASGSVTRLHDLTDRYAFARAAMDTIATRFEVVWRQAPLGMMLVSVESGAVGDVLSVNAALEVLLGRDVEDRRGVHHESLVHPDDRDGTNMFSGLADGSTPQTQREHRLVRGDGTDVWVLETAVAVADAYGRPTFAVCIFLDTTQQHDDVEQRRRSDERLATLFEHSEEVIVAYEDQGEITWASPTIERVLGFRADDQVGRSILEYFHPDELERASAEAEKMRRDPTYSARGMIRVRRADGSYAVMEGAVFVVGRDDPLEKGFILIARDVTDRLQAQEAAQQSRAELEAQVTAFGDLYFLFDRADRYLGFVGEGTFVTPERFLGRTQSEVLPEPAARALNAALSRVRVTDKEARAEYELPSDDGEHSYEARFAPLADGHVACTVRDVTEGKLAAERLIERERRLESLQVRRANERLEAQLQHAQRMESLGRLAGGVAHDFNNLLGIILNYSGLLEKAVADDEQATDDVGEIRAAAERGAALVRDLVLFGRREPTESQVFDMNDAVGEIAARLERPVGPTHGLVIRRSAEPLLVNVDPSQFEQVVVNLVLNARHATPEGARLDLRICRVFVGAGEAAARDMARGEYAVLDVEDPGVGMTPEVVERAFEPFFTTRADGGGSGLGLASAYGIVDTAGGHMTIDSEPGVGTTVSLYLPVADDPASADVISSVSPVAHTGPRVRSDEARGNVIVVVDDEQAILESTKRILETAGYRAVAVSDPLTVLDLLQDMPVAPALVLSDVRMPGMNGSDLVAKVQAQHPEIGVLLMSGYTEDLDGFRDDEIPVLAKPMSGSALLRAVETAIGERGA